MNLNQLKNKINTFQSTQKVTRAMQNIAALKITKIKHKLLLVKSNLIRVRTDFPEYFKNDEDQSLTKFVVIFGAKKGLCAGLSRRIFLDFIDKKNQVEQKKHKIIAIELPIAKLISESSFSDSLIACFDNLEDDFHPTLHVLEFLKEILSSSQSKIKIEVIWPFDQATIVFEHDSINNQLALYSLLEFAYFTTRYLEEEKRIEAMTQASDNCEKMGKETRVKYFKARQQKITQEILEISN
jgi:F0F1-type ATP synthase gamma subunit